MRLASTSSGPLLERIMWTHTGTSTRMSLKEKNEEARAGGHVGEMSYPESWRPAQHRPLRSEEEQTPR